jgi:hypothetical protein
MPIGKKTGGRDFKPGESGNPAGRPPMSPDVRAARRVNQYEFELICNRLFFLSYDEVRAVAKAKETPALERMMAKLIALACATGDERRIEVLLTRTIGKVETKVQAGQTKPPAPEGRRPEEMSDEELDQEARALAERIAAGKGP